MVGASGNKTNSAFNWAEVEVEAELGNKPYLEIEIPETFCRYHLNDLQGPNIIMSSW